MQIYSPDVITAPPLLEQRYEHTCMFYKNNKVMSCLKLKISEVKT